MKTKNAKHQQNYRDRKAQDGLYEVRGIYATKEDGEKIKQFAKKLKDGREWIGR